MRIEKCKRVAERIRELQIPPPQEEPSLNLSSLPERRRADFLHTLVAICHQTSPKEGIVLAGTVDGQYRRGWDFLSIALLHAVAEDPEIVSPRRLMQLRGKDVELLITRSDQSARISDPSGRALLLNDLGASLDSAGHESAQGLFAQSRGWLVRVDGSGLLDLLARARAYSDPVRKKSLYLCSLARSLGVWDFRDEANLGPPVDYHEIRGHLRLGTVLIHSDLIRNAIQTGKVTGELDIAVRQTVHDAILEIARHSETTPAALHYYFWNLFRSCCTRDETHCRACGQDCGLPARYRRLDGSDPVPGCQLGSVCDSRDKAEKLTDYELKTEFY